ncbi:DUF5994 family protein [Nocardia sp. NBC_00511]|uniref:DUF5994 family protein n=1 Tax=Nocardia sp. NBC_00511 TaxID=2903591 RepID=UPI0030E0B700
MTSQPSRTPHPAPGGAAYPRKRIAPTIRVAMKPNAPRTGQVDGAWWPYTEDLLTELPGLITALAPRLGPVLKVGYFLVDWETPTRALVIAGQPVRLGWHGYATAHTVELFGTGNRSATLLALPPDAEPRSADAAMLAAAEPDSTATVTELLKIGVRRRRDPGGRKNTTDLRALRTTSRS